MAINSVLMMCVDVNIQQCHLIIASINVDYEEQVIIIGIKLDIQYLMY